MIGLTKIVPIAITILECQGQYLFLRRRNPPYEGLWSMVGGKVAPGEHIRQAAIREVHEETRTTSVSDYEYRGLVTERLTDPNGALLAHFLIFVGHASISNFESSHREGDLELFSMKDVTSRKSEFLPSDYEMFHRFLEPDTQPRVFEAELLRSNKGYHLVYFREP
ncbi:MAG: NUDIX domain-containing protein [Candidatus Thorarchaeota archaeon]